MEPGLDGPHARDRQSDCSRVCGWIRLAALRPDWHSAVAEDCGGERWYLAGLGAGPGGAIACERPSSVCRLHRGMVRHMPVQQKDGVAEPGGAGGLRSQG